MPLSTLIHPEVAATLADGQAVVALESTIFSNLGLPSPANREALDRCLTATRAGGAVPAITAVLDGVARVGLDPAEHDRICGPARKVAERDLGVGGRGAVGLRRDHRLGASLALADAAGIEGVLDRGDRGGASRGRRHRAMSRPISTPSPTIPW